MKRLTTVLLALCLCVPIALIAQGTPSDDRIYDEVRRRLTNDRDVKGGAITVEVKGGLVKLMGKTKSPKESAKAEKIAKKVKGVTGVFNELRLE